MNRSITDVGASIVACAAMLALTIGGGHVLTATAVSLSGRLASFWILGGAEQSGH